MDRARRRDRRRAGAIVCAIVAFAACKFDSSPILGGPGLEPPGSPREGMGANAAGSSALPGGGSTEPAPVGTPGDMKAPDAATPDARALGPDASPTGVSEAGPMDATMDSHDAAIVDAGGVGTCRGWSKPGGPCPMGCANCDLDRGVCTIDCIGFPGLCANTTLECPAGWACHVNCSGLGVCRNGGIVCADGPCDVNCSGLGNCDTWTIQCGRDACKVDCPGVVGTGLTFMPGDSCNADRQGC